MSSRILSDCMSPEDADVSEMVDPVGIGGLVEETVSNDVGDSVVVGIAGIVVSVCPVVGIEGMVFELTVLTVLKVFTVVSIVSNVEDVITVSVKVIVVD